MRALVTIGGFAMPEPAQYIPSTGDAVDGARNLNNNFIGSAVGDGSKSKIEVEYRWLSAATWSSVLARFNRRVGGKFVATVTFYDQDIANWRTTDMYVSDRTSSGMFRRNPDGGDVMGWLGCRLALVEA